MGIDCTEHNKPLIQLMFDVSLFWTDVMILPMHQGTNSNPPPLTEGTRTIN